MFLYRASQTLFPFSILNCLFKAQGVCEVRCLKLLIKEWNIFFEVQVVFWFVMIYCSRWFRTLWKCIFVCGLWRTVRGGGSNFVWVMPICTEVLPDLLQSNYEWHIIFKYVFYTNFTKTCTHTLLSISLRWGDWEVLSVRLFIVRCCCCSATLLFSQHWTLLTDIVLHAMQRGPCYRDGTLCLLCRNKNFVIFTNMLETLGQFKRMNVFLHLYKVGNTPWN